MMKKLSTSLFVALMTAVVGCGAPPPAGSCSVTASAGMAMSTACIDYEGSSVSADVIRAGCTQGGGTFQSNGCSATGRVGRCTLPGGTPQLTQTQSYYAPFTTADVMTACTASGGTFIAQ